MNQADFNYIAALLKERSGLIVTQEKTYLFETRLLPIARANKLASLDQLIAMMRTGQNEKADRCRGRGDDHQRDIPSFATAIPSMR